MSRIWSPGNVSGDCKCRPISVKRNLKNEANVVISESSIMLPCSRLLNSMWLFFTFYFRGGCVLTTKTQC